LTNDIADSDAPITIILNLSLFSDLDILFVDFLDDRFLSMLLFIIFVFKLLISFAFSFLSFLSFLFLTGAFLIRSYNVMLSLSSSFSLLFCDSLFSLLSSNWSFSKPSDSLVVKSLLDFNIFSSTLSLCELKYTSLSFSLTFCVSLSTDYLNDIVYSSINLSFLSI